MIRYDCAAVLRRRVRPASPRPTRGKLHLRREADDGRVGLGFADRRRSIASALGGVPVHGCRIDAAADGDACAASLVLSLTRWPHRTADLTRPRPTHRLAHALFRSERLLRAFPIAVLDPFQE
jgi:hypothetical protein